MSREDILALAKDLAEKLAGSDEYKSLKQAESELNAHTAAQIMWQDLEKKQRACQDPGLSQEELKDRYGDMQKTLELVGHNPYIRQLLLAQMAMGQLWAEIHKILAEAIGIKIEGQGESSDENKG
jgi:cell fate (sporulation/competence/biofilm development) regulator YlbF (YheA/YmcA/DUF963 family)